MPDDSSIVKLGYDAFPCRIFGSIDIDISSAYKKNCCNTHTTRIRAYITKVAFTRRNCSAAEDAAETRSTFGGEM